MIVCDIAHHIVKNEAVVRELQVFEEAVKFAAVQCAPGTMQVISGLRLLPCVIVVQELQSSGNRETVATQQHTIYTRSYTCTLLT